jgi:hypothetical protein
MFRLYRRVVILLGQVLRFVDGFLPFLGEFIYSHSRVVFLVL